MGSGCTRMVGRTGELRRLLAAWSEVATAGRAGAARPVLITGEPGTGKSLLVASALAAFTPAPGIVLSGAARVHSPAPYDWLASVLDSHEPGDAVRPGAVHVPPDALAWLAQHPDAPRTRYAPDGLLRMAVRLVRGLVDTRPAVVVVEDLHALDPASLNLVGELATGPRLPALLLVTCRLPEPDAGGSLVARTLSRLCGAPDAVRLHLGPLTTGEVAELLAAGYPSRPVPASAVDAALQKTGGNPYRLRELLVTSRDPTYLAVDSVAAEPTAAEPTAAELTVRETEVLSCLANGMSNKQIARALGISIRTVTVHVSNLLRKTGSASRTEAALWAVRRQPAGRT